MRLLLRVLLLRLLGLVFEFVAPPLQPRFSRWPKLLTLVGRDVLLCMPSGALADRELEHRAHRSRPGRRRSRAPLLPLLVEDVGGVRWARHSPPFSDAQARHGLVHRSRSGRRRSRSGPQTCDLVPHRGRLPRCVSDHEIRGPSIHKRVLVNLVETNLSSRVGAALAHGWCKMLRFLLWNHL